MSDDPTAAIRATMFLSTEVAWRLTDVMVAKGVLSKEEARGTLYAIAEGIRRDAHGTSSEELANMLGRSLEDTADETWPRE